MKNHKNMKELNKEIISLINNKEWSKIIKKYDINKPLWNGNYLIHYLGYTGDEKLFNNLKKILCQKNKSKKKINLYEYNNEGEIYIYY